MDNPPKCQRYKSSISVFSRHNNLKRGIALLGVALALLSGVEHTHLLCQLGGCSEVSAEKVCHHHETDEAKAATCSHSCKSTIRTLAAKPASDEGESAHQDGSCPCPPDCWCHRSPQPLELPRAPSESSVAQLVNLLSSHCVASAAICVDAEPHHGTSELNPLAQTSPERCASLCRFLI